VSARRCEPGCSTCVKKALRCWIHAAEQGELEAQEIPRNLYLTGDARVQCAQDLHEAFRWGRTAAEQGGAKAQSQLGVIQHLSRDNAPLLKHRAWNFYDWQV
jgi:TPR repeat protein